MIANLRDQNALLKSQLQAANTKKYAPICPIITLDNIPIESRDQVQTLSRSLANIEIPVIPAKLTKEINDKINLNNFTTKIWRAQRDYMKKFLEVLREWNYPGCPETLSDMIEIVGMDKRPFALHLLSTMQLVSSDVLTMQHGIDIDLEHLQSKNPLLHKVWADNEPNPSKAMMSIFHFSLATLAPKKANMVKGSSFIANFEQVFNDDRSLLRWTNTGHDSDQLHYAFTAFQNEVVAWYVEQDSVNLIINGAVTYLRRKKDFEFAIGFHLLPNFNRLTGLVELDETNGELDAAATNESTENDLQELNVHCDTLVMTGKTWNVGIDTTASKNIASNISYIDNELNNCAHFGQIPISGLVITEQGPRDFVVGDKSGAGCKRLKPLIKGKLELPSNPHGGNE